MKYVCTTIWSIICSDYLFCGGGCPAKDDTSGRSRYYMYLITIGPVFSEEYLTNMAIMRTLIKRLSIKTAKMTGSFNR